MAFECRYVYEVATIIWWTATNACDSAVWTGIPKSSGIHYTPAVQPEASCNPLNSWTTMDFEALDSACAVLLV